MSAYCRVNNSVNFLVGFLILFFIFLRVNIVMVFWFLLLLISYVYFRFKQLYLKILKVCRYFLASLTRLFRLHRCNVAASFARDLGVWFSLAEIFDKLFIFFYFNFGVFQCFLLL